MGRIKEFFDEWAARRAGRRHLPNDIRKSARDIIGPTGDMLSGGWDRLDNDGDAYLGSFDRRIPPSIHISQRDRTRQNIPIPLVERCIEDYGTQDEPDPATTRAGEPE